MNRIFDDTFPPPTPPNTPTPQYDQQKILNARYAAFQLLIEETRRWSDSETIKLDDSTTAKLTVTFISPELLQIIFLNDVLLDQTVNSDFKAKVQTMLNDIASREELLFLLTVTTTNNSTIPIRHTIKMPIREMFLYNAENLMAAPKHDDHNLEQLIDTSSSPVFGYVAYPLATLSGTQCKWLLDPKYNTNIVITLNSIEVDKVKNETPYSWTIAYKTLINPVTNSTTPVPTSLTVIDPALITPLAVPPNEQYPDIYWRDFARYVWNQITPGH